ncbi:hypothetical protein J2738_004261 [Variovorax paradoxus]|uniref:Uncharacterized protein n=1 Tax=Variovorax paradoxus TaxID=34073 RepID=A0AAE3Y2F2_VARPD|nr:hypothetical protein [Variovorax paradoxus]MDR6428106.1 hypothetical protein [Variovorax paradoxus]
MPSRFVSHIANSTIEIIDCLHAERDLQTGISICNHLRDLTPEGVPRIRRHSIESEDALWACLDEIENDCVRGWKAIVHLEGHACKAGFELRRGIEPPYPIVPWGALVDRFRHINVASQFNLGVFLAACEGIEALRPMTIKKSAPYMFLAGPNVVVSAGVMKVAAERFYDIIVTAPDLGRALASLPAEFSTFLAERFFATTYARVLKAQSFGRNRRERVDSLVNMVVPDNAPLEQVRSVREMARVFARPDRERYEAVQQNYLPAGVSFMFDDLVEFARTGRVPN